MKIALLHGAYLNSGDFLILNRTKQLLRHCYPNCCINEYYRNMNLDDIKIPMMMLGLGWWDSDSNVDTIYNYRFSDDMKRLLTRVTNDSKILGCRDYLSCNVLRNNGYIDVAMTGCPAWYDIENINRTKYNGKELVNADKICISDCANINNYENVITLITFIKKFFGDKNIY